MTTWSAGEERHLFVVQKAFPSGAVVSEQILLDVMKGLVICVHA
jgi:hypothetical protein